MNGDELATFLRDNIEPLKDPIYGDRYRAAAHLTDGTHLPCVVFQPRRKLVDLALRRFEELRKNKEQYRDVVASFVADGSSVAYWDIKTVEASPFAWPIRLLKTIHGETAMGWTAFVVEMKDGTMHSYGTQFNVEFFDLPQTYSYQDIARIHSGFVFSEAKKFEQFSMAAIKTVRPYREKPFFTCCLDEL